MSVARWFLRIHRLFLVALSIAVALRRGSNEHPYLYSILACVCVLAFLYYVIDAVYSTSDQPKLAVRYCCFHRIVIVLCHSRELVSIVLWSCDVSSANHDRGCQVL